MDERDLDDDAPSKGRRPRAPWDHWYGTAKWQRRRQHQLRTHPLCRICEEQRGLIVPAMIADHVEPHKGDYAKFAMGALQSLCYECHQADKRQSERMGYSTRIGVDGWPIDKEHHPAWKVRT
jgi:hypothetical protein